MKSSTKATTKVNEVLNVDVERYIDIKNNIKELTTEKLKLRGIVYLELATEISAIKASGVSTKASYKRALDGLKIKYYTSKAINFELGLLTYFLNLGLSLNKIESNASNLSKWRRDKLSLAEIIKIAK